ncbi:NADPH-dependent F420 reductase [Uliginosibacterium sp. 31-12]|uniref:NADPH-dependent F420 reductase n=1 Tax=Uliginosibacterium sp. 31-12 TaxID=3062781 RepID=UPI0026E2582F|nr:NAD(P)-binding domain-containing protein [Uliginosibacterium sp. 31-12]MDO6387743.1 NAD(P)-binding domain-containing protein [Uliginosibacterium sp. 31-12]
MGSPAFQAPPKQRKKIMNIGIIGAGALGSNLARALARKGLSATISNSRGPASLAPLVAELGPTIKAGTTAEAASADIVVVAVRWSDLGKVLGSLPAWNGRIVIDGTNPVEFLDPNAPADPSNPLAAYGIKAVDLGGKYSSEVFRELVPGARVVKAFNHLDVNVLAEPEVSGGQRVQFYSGDDAAAKAEVRKLLEAIGYFAVDLGALDVGGRLAELPFGSLAATNFIKI